MKEWVHESIALVATFAFDWKVLIFSLLPFGIIFLLANLSAWIDMPVLYAGIIAFFMGFVTLNKRDCLVKLAMTSGDLVRNDAR